MFWAACRKKLILMGALACLLSSFPSAAEELYNCDGVVQNRPCKSESRSEFIDMDKPLDLPVGKHVLTPPVESASPTAAPTVSAAVSQLELRPLIAERPDPVLKWQIRKQDKFSIQFTGKVSGHGAIELKVYAALGSAVAKIKLKELRSMMLNFPPEGGSKEFEATVGVPAATVYGWVLEARNKGHWRGYHNLQGCCEEAGVEARCLPGGSVQCGKKKLSERCRCQNW